MKVKLQKSHRLALNQNEMTSQQIAIEERVSLNNRF
jgi:hypothetical protein